MGPISCRDSSVIGSSLSAEAQHPRAHGPDHHPIRVMISDGLPPRLAASRKPRGRTPMATLIAIAYPDAAVAEQARAQLVQATKEHLLELQDAVVVERQADGKI